MPTSRSASRTSRSSRGEREVTRVSATASAPSGVRIWLMAARVRTLPASIAPVLVGTALAGQAHVFHPLRFIAALVGACHP